MEFDSNNKKLEKGKYSKNENYDEIKYKYIKIIGIIIVSGILWFLLKLIIPINLPNLLTKNLQESIFVRYSIAQILSIIYAILVLSCEIGFFLKIHKELPGTRLSKGLKYGGFFAGLTLISFLAVAIFLDTKFVYTDAIPVMCCGIMSGVFLSKNTEIEKKVWTFRDFFSITIIGVVYLGIHSLLGLFFADKTDIRFIIMFIPNNVAQIICIFLIGIWIGFIYLLLKPGLNCNLKIKNNILFSIGIFGTFWLLYNFFYNIYYDGIIFETIGIAILDIIAIMIGVSIVDYIQNRKRH